VVLKAPKAGVVMGMPKMEEVNKRWEPDREKPFCKIADLTKLRILVPVSKSEIDLIRADLARRMGEGKALTVTVRIPGRASETWEGRITRVPESEAKEIPIQLSDLVPQEQVYLVGVDLVDPDSSLCPGTLAEVTIRQTSLWAG
jgi:putative peptide zinc metalloprotease protein